MRKVAMGILLIGAIFASGCAAALLGGGLIGGMMISDDTVENTFESSVDKVWKVCIDYLDQNGEIVKIDKDNGIIYAEKVFGNRYVQIQITGRPSGTRVAIKARKTIKLLPDVDTGVRVMTDLIRRLD